MPSASTGVFIPEQRVTCLFCYEALKAAISNSFWMNGKLTAN